MKIAITIIAMALVAALTFAWQQYNVIDDQRAALEIWANCPMPAKGTMLVVEADWPDQQPEDKYRCSFARKRLPGKLGRPLHQKPGAQS